MDQKNTRYIASFLVLFVQTALFLSLSAIAAETADKGIVRCSVEARVADTDPKGINVRSGPGQNYPVVDTLPYRSPVTIYGSVGEWMCINWGSPRRWVYGPFLSVVATTDARPDPSGLVPIHADSGDDSGIIAWAPQNTEFTVIGCESYSVKVQYKDVEGWLSGYDNSQDLSGLSIVSGGGKTPDKKIIPCENVAAYVVDNDPKGANVREGPGSDYSTILTLPTDRPVQVRIVGSLKDWVLIKDPVFRSKVSGEMTMDITAWVKATLLGVRAENAEDFAGPVKLYRDANAESGVVGEVPGGTGVTILAAKGAWLKVKYEKQEGWLAPDAQCGDPFKECH